MNDKILSINIDMGMNHNGVYYALLESAGNSEEKYVLKDKSAVCINKGDINYSKVSRRLKRHITAGYQREKLAKRLFDEVININDYTKKQQEILHGLFKNRGFTYLTISDEFEQVDDEYINYIEEKINNNQSIILKDLYTLEDIENAINMYSSDDEILSKYIESVLQEIKIILEPYYQYLEKKKELKNKNIKDDSIKPPLTSGVYKSLKNIRDIFLSQQKEITLGQKPRKTYLKDIEKLVNQIDFVDKFSHKELYNIVCNISNLQLRCLRKYFNGKYDDKFNNQLLGDKLYKFYISRHYRKDDKNELESKEYLKPFLLSLKEDRDGLKFLKTAEPLYTIPPMEDMNNRGSSKCNVLLIKDEFIDDDIKKCLDTAYGKGIFIDHNGEVIEDISYFHNDYEKAFRRFADYSLNMIDKTKTTPVPAGFISESSHPRKVFTYKNINDEYFKSFYFKGYEKEYTKFRELLIKYYSEEKNILSGIYTEQQSIFRPCGCNAPLKNNVKEILIKSLFRDIKGEFSKEDVKEFENKIYNTIYKGRSTIYSFISKVSEQAKKDKNSFFANMEFFYKNKKQINKNEMLFSFEDAEKVISKIAEILFDMKKINAVERDNFSILDESTLKNRINILKQLFDILDKKMKGYYKTCKTHTEENEQRSQVYSSMGHAVYKRLLSRVSKPIDGMLDMHLDRLAYDIVKNIPFDISQFNKLEINVEENRFYFEEGLKEIKGGKSKKKQSKEKLICPYTGKEIVNGDYDHIIPRSSRLGIFNSAANLIYCSQEGNQSVKGSKEYGLNDLNKAHLKQVFGTDKIDEIIQYISNNLKTIDKQNYTNFNNLNKHQQNAFRYALFLYKENNELFNTALELLKQDKLKTITNGTQKRLISLIYEKALLKNNNLECSAGVVESMLVRAVRNDLSGEDSKLMKAEKQNTHSHCIDASIVFYLSHSNAKSKSIQSKYADNSNNVKPEYNYFKEIYLEESSIDLIEKKRKFITLEKSQHDMDSIKYFDDTIYSIYIKPFKISDDKKTINNLNTLITYNLLFKHINKGKKQFIKTLEEVNKNDYLWVDKQKYFDLLFSLFHAGKVKELENLKFMDDNISSKTKKEIKQLFFKDGDLKKDLLVIENMSKPLTELYSRFEKEFKNVEEDEREEKYEKICKEFFNPHNSKRLRKTKRIYSLDVEGQANYIIRRSKNTYQALRSKDIATPTYIVGNDTVNIEFYSKNAIPFKIKKLLNILKYKDTEKEHIYEKEVKNISMINKDAAKYIKYLTYTFSESGRVRIAVVLNKSAFQDINFNNMIENAVYNIKDEAVKILVDNYINNIECPVYQLIGKPRTDKKQIKVLKKTVDNITLSYPRRIDKEFQNFIKTIYETHSN